MLPQAPGFTHYLPARKTSGSKACSHRLRASHTICPPEKPVGARLAPTGSGLHTLFARQKNQWEQGCSHRLRASHTICPLEKPVGARLLPLAPGFTHYLPARKTCGSKACSHRLRASHTICLPEKPVGARLARDGAGTDTSYHRRAKVSPRTPDTLRQCTRASRIMKFTRVGETPSSLAMSFCGTPCRRYISKA